MNRPYAEIIKGLRRFDLSVPGLDPTGRGNLTLFCGPYPFTAPAVSPDT